MPRKKSIVTVIRELVQREVQDALSGLFGGQRKKATNGRRRRRGRRGPGRPPGSKNKPKPAVA